jgi:hypothetical protein
MEYKHEGFAKHNHDLFVGQKIRTRGDIGHYKGVIVQIHNESYCTIKSHGKHRHMNMAFIEPRPASNNWFKRIILRITA